LYGRLGFNDDYSNFCQVIRVSNRNIWIVMLLETKNENGRLPVKAETFSDKIGLYTLVDNKKNFGLQVYADGDMATYQKTTRYFKWNGKHMPYGSDHIFYSQLKQKV